MWASEDKIAIESLCVPAESRGMNLGHLAGNYLFQITPDFISAFICCFRVRVVQERSPLAELLAEESEAGETRDSNFLEKEDRIFSWQDKVFGPFEIDFYADEKNCVTDYQREYHRRIRDEQLQGSRLYSYTENDAYYADDDLLTMPYRQGSNLTVRCRSWRISAKYLNVTFILK